MKSNYKFLALTATLTTLLSLQGGLFAATLGFNATTNPNPVAGGTISYGYTTSLSGAFLTDNFSGTWLGLQEWTPSGPVSSNPAVRYNPSASAILFSATTFDPMTLSLHPGSSGEYAVIRYSASSAPATELCSFVGSFWGQDAVGTTTDVHVLHNGVSVFSSNVNGFGVSSAKTFALNFAVNPGDTVDFAVGRGSNNTFFNDSTGFRVDMTHIPEPGSATLGLAALALLGRRRRMRY